MRPGLNRVADNLIFLMPDFIHEIGDSAHHMSMVRTCAFDEYGGPIPGTGPSDLRYFLHELLDDNIFYPIARWIHKFVSWGNNDLGQRLRNLLGFFWGLNCGFPARDVLLHTIWTLHGCKPRAVFEKVDGEWVNTYQTGRRG